MKEHNTKVFIVYRIALGLLLLALVATHKIDNSAPAAIEKKEKAAAAATVRIAPNSNPTNYGV